MESVSSGHLSGSVCSDAPGGPVQPSRFSWRHVLVVFVLAVSTSVATRIFHNVWVNGSTAGSGAADVKRQQLDVGALELTRPGSHCGGLLARVAVRRVHGAERRIQPSEFTEGLFNRPPPSVFLSKRPS